MPAAGAAPRLLNLPPEVLLHVLSYLNSRYLTRMQKVCTELLVNKPARKAPSLLLMSASPAQHDSLIEKAAKAAILRKHPEEAEDSRWGKYTWLMRMRIDETFSPFDSAGAAKAGFTITPTASGQLHVKLAGATSRLLLSQQTTGDTQILHWRLQLQTDTALELGVVPVGAQVVPMALHRCTPNESIERPTGITNAMTTTSQLPCRAPLMAGTQIDLLLCCGYLEAHITQPAGAVEWVRCRDTVVPRAYHGPTDMSVIMKCSYTAPAKLALTCFKGTQLVTLLG